MRVVRADSSAVIPSPVNAETGMAPTGSKACSIVAASASLSAPLLLHWRGGEGRGEVGDSSAPADKPTPPSHRRLAPCQLIEQARLAGIGRAEDRHRDAVA